MLQINLLAHDQIEARLKEWPRLSGAQRLRDLYARVFRRSLGRCVYCGTIKGPFQMDHPVPWIRGGTFLDARNLVLACPRCNQRKGYRTAAEFGHPEVQDEPQPQETYGQFCLRQRDWRG